MVTIINSNENNCGNPFDACATNRINTTTRESALALSLYRAQRWIIYVCTFIHTANSRTTYIIDPTNPIVEQHTTNGLRHSLYLLGVGCCNTYVHKNPARNTHTREISKKKKAKESIDTWNRMRWMWSNKPSWCSVPCLQEDTHTKEPFALPAKKSIGASLSAYQCPCVCVCVSLDHKFYWSISCYSDSPLWVGRNLKSQTRGNKEIL